MGKKPATKALPKGQGSITSFLLKGKDKETTKKTKKTKNAKGAEEKETVDASDASDSGDEPDNESDTEADVEPDAEEDVEVAEQGTTTRKKSQASPESSELPPIHDIPAIFSDLVSRIPEMQNVASHVAGRKLRVATMCSGTESPLLALELVQKSIHEQHDINLDIEHVFSCEIEPFKQAYIERNFQPPLLFRDVCELGDDEA